MDILAHSLGLVTDKDVVSLSGDLNVQGSFLFDGATGARHRLRGPAGPALIFLSEATTARAWFRRAAGVGLSKSEAASLICDLNDIAGLNIQNSQSFKPFLRLRLRLRGGRPVSYAWRYSGTVRGLVFAVSRAIRPVLGAVLILLVLSFGANTLSLTFIFTQASFVLVLFITTILHESVHLWQARRNGAAACVVVRRFRVGVLHERLVNRDEVNSAFAGPLVGSFSAFALAGILVALSTPISIVTTIGLVGLFHWVSWLPNFGDGKTIKKYWRSWHA